MATRAPVSSAARVCSILAIVFGVVAVVFFPIIFGVAAIVLGLIGYRGDQRLGRTALIVAVAGTVLGLLLAYLALPS